jgi:MoxR-like ATPase
MNQARHSSSLSPTSSLSAWRDAALALQAHAKSALIGQENAIQLLTIALFARGHALLEGDVGVGKTTLLKAFARLIGGAFSRVEGTIDLMPSDLIYYTYINEEGQPRVSEGPLLKHGPELSLFFFNEINRARPQVQSLLLRVMAERSVSAFNREHAFPHVLVLADRNRVEREETFELAAATRDRFMMEIPVSMPSSEADQLALMFEPRFHDADALIEALPSAVLNYQHLGDIAAQIQTQISVSPYLQRYALQLWQATRAPAALGIALEGVDMQRLILAGASPRGVSLMMRAARVAAWLAGRDMVVPEDIQAVFHATMTHRVFFQPVYEMRRAELAPLLLDTILNKVSAP